jgi:hypothetical protein
VNLSEFLFLQAHREIDCFFASSGVLSAQSDRGFFHYQRTAFSSMLKSRVGNILAKDAALRNNLNLDGGAYRIEISHSSLPLANFLSINLVCLSVFQFHDQPSVCEACRFLIFSFQSFITPILIYYISLLFTSYFIDS